MNKLLIIIIKSVYLKNKINISTFYLTLKSFIQTEMNERVDGLSN